MRPLRVTAVMAGPLAGDPPHLDALLEKTMVVHLSSMGKEQLSHDRTAPAPPQGYIPIPMARAWVGTNEWLVARCSDPIFWSSEREHVEHFTRAIDTANADVLAEEKRRIFATGNSWTRSYRLPLRIRNVDRIVWFCVGQRKDMRRRLRKEIFAIGKKTALGYGAVSEWIVENADQDLSWYANTDGGSVLMRTMPNGPWLPDDLVGARPSYGSAVPPYWHPERFTEIVVPC